jgi:hypothetical protein
VDFFVVAFFVVVFEVVVAAAVSCAIGAVELAVIVDDDVVSV